MSPRYSYAFSPGSAQFSSMCRIHFYKTMLAKRQTGAEPHRLLANANLRENSLVTFCEAPVSMFSMMALVVQSPIQRPMTMREVRRLPWVSGHFKQDNFLYRNVWALDGVYTLPLGNNISSIPSSKHLTHNQLSPGDQ